MRPSPTTKSPARFTWHLLLPLMLAGCGPADSADYDSNAEPIINGHACSANEQPATVAVLAHFTVISNQREYKLTMLLCTGTLIAPDTVLTAAHCVDEGMLSEMIGAPIAEAQFFISYQANLQRASDAPVTDEVKATSFVQNPSFNFDSDGNGAFQHYYDLALLFLEKAQTVQPELVIAMSEAGQIQAGKEVLVGGWGQQTPAQDPPDSSVGVKQCAPAKINQVGVYEMQIGTSSSPRKCHGDSGGPTFMDVETTVENKRRLIGVTSRAYDSSDCGNGGVDTRLNGYIEWLDKAMMTACQKGKRVACQTPGLPSPYPVPTPKGCSGVTADWLAVCGLALLRRRGSGRSAQVAAEAAER